MMFELKINAMLTPLVLESLATAYASATTTDGNGNQHRQQGSYSKTDGSTGQSEDLWFVTNPSVTRQVDPPEIPDDVHALPEIQGSGKVANEANHNKLFERKGA